MLNYDVEQVWGLAPTVKLRIARASSEPAMQCMALRPLCNPCVPLARSIHSMWVGSIHVTRLCLSEVLVVLLTVISVAGTILQIQTSVATGFDCAAVGS
jgi:hypothetical protein